MYFAAPFLSQATIALSALSVPVPWRFSGFVQSRAANCAFNSGVTAAAGVAAGSAGAADAAPGAVASTCLNRNSAVWPTNSTTRRPVSPELK